MNAAPDSLIAPGTDWMPHSEFSAPDPHELSTCPGTLRVARRTAVSKNAQVLEIECSAPDCLFETTTDDVSFRRAQEGRRGVSEDDQIWFRR